MALSVFGTFITLTPKSFGENGSKVMKVGLEKRRASPVNIACTTLIPKMTSMTSPNTFPGRAKDLPLKAEMVFPPLPNRGKGLKRTNDTQSPPTYFVPFVMYKYDLLSVISSL